MNRDYTIHDQAASVFNEKAVGNKARVGPVSPPSRGRAPQWRPDIHVIHVPESDIQDLRFLCDYPVAEIYEVKSGLAVGLVGDPAAEFLRLAEQLWRAIKPKGTVSKKRAIDLACDWLFKGDSSDSLTKYVLDAASAEAALTKVWVPISGLDVQARFQVGSVTFEPLTAERIESWHKSDGYSKLDEDRRNALGRYYADFSKEHRGHAIGWTELVADKEQAKILGLERIEDSLAMLRFFSGGAIVPSARSICTPSGRERKEGYRVVLEREGRFAGESRGLLDAERARPWRVSRSEVADLMRSGLAKLSDLLNANELSQFQERVLASARLFSDAALEHRLQVKLVLVLSALEGVYLGSRGEPIQQNIGERLAIMTESTPEARLAVTKLVRDVYDVRSNFVHHAERVESSDAMASFFRSAWHGVVRAIEHADRHTSVRDFTEAIDLEKFR